MRQYYIPDHGKKFQGSMKRPTVCADCRQFFEGPAVLRARTVHSGSGKSVSHGIIGCGRSMHKCTIFSGQLSASAGRLCSCLQYHLQLASLSSSILRRRILVPAVPIQVTTHYTSRALQRAVHIILSNLPMTTCMMQHGHTNYLPSCCADREVVASSSSFVDRYPTTTRRRAPAISPVLPPSKKENRVAMPPRVR